MGAGAGSTAAAELALGAVIAGRDELGAAAVATGAAVAMGAPDGAGSPRHWQQNKGSRGSRAHGRRWRIARSSIVDRGAQRPIVRHIATDNLAPHARFLTRRHLPGLDGLRCLAILPVIWHHATPRLLPGVLGKGAVGVDLFFALSGFLITTLLLRELRAHGRVALGDFYARRSLRIFPLYYALLAAYALRELLHADLPSAQHFLHGLPYHATYTANWFLDYDVPHPIVFAFSWSLCVEEQFYWVWPGLVALVRSRWLLAGFMLLAIVVDYAAEHALFGGLPPGTRATRIVSSFATPIGCGSLMALLLDAPLGFRLAHWGLGWRWAAPLLLLASVGCLMVPATPYLTLSATLAALVAAVALRPDSGFVWLLERAPLRRLGTLSYALYLLHITALGLIRRFLPGLAESAVWVFALGLPLSVVFAEAAHRVIERPFLRMRSRFH